jgi:hypothetical protein
MTVVQYLGTLLLPPAIFAGVLGGFLLIRTAIQVALRRVARFQS